MEASNKNELNLNLWKQYLRSLLLLGVFLCYEVLSSNPHFDELIIVTTPSRATCSLLKSFYILTYYLVYPGATIKSPHWPTSFTFNLNSTQLKT